MKRLHIPHPDEVPDDVRCYYRHARRVPEPVVELGVEHGRYLLPLADQEIRLVAVGEQADLLRTLRAFAMERHLPLEVHVAAWHEVPVSKIGMFYLPEGRLARILTYEAVMAFLRRVHAALQIGGKFMFDLPLPDPKQIDEQAGLLRLWREEQRADGGRRYIWERRQYDIVHQIEVRHLVEEHVAPNGVTLERRHRIERRRWFWPTEMRAMLEATGFYLEALYGGFGDEPLTATSRRQVWVVRRPLD